METFLCVIPASFTTIFWNQYGYELWIQTIKGPFGNIVLVTLFVFFENMCGWKSVWKYV